VAGIQCRQAEGEVGGANGQVREHQGIAAGLVDLHAALYGGRSRLSAWRPMVQRREGEPTSVVLHGSSWHRRKGRGGRWCSLGARGGIDQTVQGQSQPVMVGKRGGHGGNFSWCRC
jgi:hypothetical protein